MDAAKKQIVLKYDKQPKMKVYGLYYHEPNDPRITDTFKVTFLIQDGAEHEIMVSERDYYICKAIYDVDDEREHDRWHAWDILPDEVAAALADRLTVP